MEEKRTISLRSYAQYRLRLAHPDNAVVSRQAGVCIEASTIGTLLTTAVYLTQITQNTACSLAPIPLRGSPTTYK